MKKYWSLLILIPFLSIMACMDDTSAYLPQDKENVDVENNFNVDTTNTDSVLPEGELVPGLHLVKMKVLQPNHTDSVVREFKYYMPVTINPAKPISLIFDFHGSYTFESGEEPGNPMSSTTESNPLNQLATANNCIICYPAALPIFQADSSGTVNWMDSENHFPFVDALIKYFTEDNEPYVDRNRIYSTGHSSGAIFSFVLAFERSEVFAAIAPRAGQMTIKNEPVMPERAVPVRVFAGETDENVSHSAVLDNMTDWAEKIGGYFVSDMKMDTTTYEGYADVTIRYWHGGNADYEIYSMAGIGHNISLTECIDDLWDFMDTHPMDLTEENLFVSSNYKKIDAQCGEPFEIKINYTEGATLKMPTLPKGWTVQPKLRGKVDNSSFTLIAPKDFYGAIEREGVLTFTVSKGEQTASCEIEYSLNAPKTYFEVGDVYYNEKYEPIGVVAWVNQDNIQEGKIISLKKPGKYGTITYCGRDEGLGLGFQTPDRKNGYQNTQEMLARNKTFATPYTADNAAFVWASEYSEKGEKDWYFPAIEELAAINSNLSKINKALQSIEGDIISGNLYSSTTIVEDGAKKKTFFYFNFSKGSEINTQPLDDNSEYLGFVGARAMKKVTK